MIRVSGRKAATANQNGSVKAAGLPLTRTSAVST